MEPSQPTGALELWGRGSQPQPGLRGGGGGALENSLCLAVGMVAAWRTAPLPFLRVELKQHCLIAGCRARCWLGWEVESQFAINIIFALVHAVCPAVSDLHTGEDVASRPPPGCTILSLEGPEGGRPLGLTEGGGENCGQGGSNPIAQNCGKFCGKLLKNCGKSAVP